MQKMAENSKKGRRPKVLGKKQLVPAWKQQEEKTRKVLRGKKTRGSGCGREKGDVFNASFLCENKTTSKDSIAVKRSVLSKIMHEARPQGKVPLLTIGFDKGVVGTDSDFVLIAERNFEALMMASECLLVGDIEQAREWAEQVIKSE